MRKKTLIKNYKKKKGGESFISNIIGDKQGPLIPENITNEVDKGNKQVLLNKYKRIKEDAEKEYIRVKQLYDDDQINAENASKRFWNFIIKVIGPVLSKLIIYFGYSINLLLKIIEKIIVFSRYIIDFIRSFFWTFKTIIIDILKSRGIILVFLIFIIVIIIIISLIYGGGMPNPFQGNNIFQNTSAQITSFNQLKPESPYSILSKQLQNLIPIPDEYSNQFNKFKNDFYKFFGKDTILEDINTSDRETIKEGRYDSIYHIKKSDEINIDKIYNIIKPKSITITHDIINQNNIDYYKLPENIKKEDKYNINNYSINVDISSNTSGKFYYDMDNAYYYSNTDVTKKEIKKINTNNLSPFITSTIKNSDDIIYTSYNIRHIPIENYLYTDIDILNPKVKKNMLFKYENNKYNYPLDNYIIEKLKKIK